MSVVLKLSQCLKLTEGASQLQEESEEGTDLAYSENYNQKL